MINLDSKTLWLPGMDESMIFVPNDIEDLLCILPDSDATKSEQDLALLINKSSQEFLNREIEVDTYMDILDSVGIDPFFHIQRALWVVANL
ncbi:hypothetical protein [Microcoleus sp. herbarium14]|uniref:hypothetical protein n=1 Tax=Microcoleus sp. herbarium14 TaxID=3055439 RepID=UPI002FD77D85